MTGWGVGLGLLLTVCVDGRAPPLARALDALTRGTAQARAGGGPGERVDRLVAQQQQRASLGWDPSGNAALGWDSVVPAGGGPPGVFTVSSPGVQAEQRRLEELFQVQQRLGQVERALERRRDDGDAAAEAGEWQRRTCLLQQRAQDLRDVSREDWQAARRGLHQQVDALEQLAGNGPPPLR